MSLRLLFGILGPGLSDLNNQSSSERVVSSEKTIVGDNDNIIDFQTPAKFHIGMLSISLITGLCFGGYIAYKTWMEKNMFLDYVRNLIIVLVFRTFFSIIFDGAILLGTLSNVGGGNALLAFEQICLNLVLALWLTLTIYLHARVQRNFNSEPTLRLYQYGVPVVSLFFAFVWIFTMQDQEPSALWWLILNPKSQWIVNSVNLLFLLIQLGLVVDISRMMMKVSLDNDSISIVRNIGIMMGVLIMIFWLQLGLTIGRFPFQNPTSYVYFYYLIDGLECALICLVLFFFTDWVHNLLNKISSLMTGIEETHRKMSNVKANEVLLTGKDHRRIVTIDSMYVTNERSRWKDSQEESKDVVYSNVVEPERLKKTFELYRRLNIIPTSHATVVEGEKFYDCQFQNPLELNESEKKILTSNQFSVSTSSASKSIALNEGITPKREKMNEQTQKKNAFYSSKYLILDSKENDFPKYLETRPSISSESGKNNSKEEQTDKDCCFDLNSVMPNELVRKWLIDSSESMQKNRNQTQKNQDICKSPNDENANFEKLKQKLVKVVDSEDVQKEPSSDECTQKETQSNVSETIVSTISSAITNNKYFQINIKPSISFGLSKAGRKNSDKEKHGTTITAERITTTGIIPDYSGKSLVNVKEKLETAESEKKRLVKINEVRGELKKSKSINLDLKPGSDLMPLKNKSEIKMNVEQTENLNSETQDFKISENVPSGSANVSKFETKPTMPELLKEKFPTELDKKQILKSEKYSELPVGDEENSNKENRPATPESLNQYFTYSDLLEFRSQREKQKFNQPSSISKNLFSFSDTVTSTLDSLFNATGNLFFPKSSPDTEKHGKLENLQTDQNSEMSSKQGDQQEEEKHEGSPQLKNKNEHHDFTCNTTNCDNENFRKVQNSERKRENLEPLEPQASSSPIIADKTNGNVLNEALDCLKSDSKTSDEDILGVLEFQSLITEKSVKTRDIIDLPEIELQAGKFDLNKKESSLKNKDTKTQNTKHYVAHKGKKQKFLRRVNEPKLNDLDLPINPKKIQKLNRETSQNESPPVLNCSENQIDVNETSSDSEFSIEKRKDSNSSNGSFSIDNYYAQLMNIHEKFQNPLNSVDETKKKSEKFYKK